MTRKLGKCEICGEPVLDNQGRMANTYHRYIKGVKQPKALKEWYHTYCFALHELGITISREPLNEVIK